MSHIPSGFDCAYQYLESGRQIDFKNYCTTLQLHGLCTFPVKSGQLIYIILLVIRTKLRCI